MRINFRQGIISHQASVFLSLNPSGNVSILASNRPVTLTVAHRTTNYTFSEANTITNAWFGPFSSSVHYWLYWDFNLLTFARTFGYTTLEPVAQSVEPGVGNPSIVGVIAGDPGIGSFAVSEHYVLPVGKTFAVTNSTGNNGTYTVASATFNTSTGRTTIVVNETVPSSVADGKATLDIDSNGQPLRQVGRHWYNTATNRHYVWQGTLWTEVLRVFAAHVVNGNTFLPLSITFGSFIGTQIGNTASVRSGRVLFDESSKPLRRDDGTFFTTEDQFFANATRIDAIRLESNVVRAQFPYESSVAEFAAVAWKEDGKAKTAQYDDIGTTVVGMLTESVTSGGVGAVIIQGVVENSSWNWTTGGTTGGIAVPVGTPLWINNGALTPLDPHIYDAITYPVGRVPVARVLSDDTVVFEQGLGGKGDQGPPGTITDIPPATTTSIGGVTLTVPSSNADLALVPSDLDPRLSDARTPLPHTHEATDVTFTPGSGLSSNNVEGALLELSTTKLSKSGGTMTGYLTLAANPTASQHAATKQYVDGLVSGLTWIDPLHHVNLIADNIADPTTITVPGYSDVYIVAPGGVGDWIGLDGHFVLWGGSSWTDLGTVASHAAGLRFGIAIESSTTPSGTFAGKKNQIVTLENPTTLSWSFYTPIGNDATYVNNEESLHAFHQYVYDSVHTKWIEFGGPQAIVTGANLTLTGNVLDVKQYSDGGEVDSKFWQGLIPSDLDSVYSPISHIHSQIITSDSSTWAKVEHNITTSDSKFTVRLGLPTTQAVLGDDILSFDSSTSGSGFIIKTPSGNTSSNISGTDFSLLVGNGDGTGVGGQLNLSAGSSGETADAGDVVISAGDSSVTTTVRPVMGPSYGTGGDIKLKPGAGSGGDGKVVVARNTTGAASGLIFEDNSSGAWVGFKAPIDITAGTTGNGYTTVWKLPEGDGTAGQAIVTDGIGNLSWASAGGLPTSTTQCDVLVADGAGGWNEQSVPQLSQKYDVAAQVLGTAPVNATVHKFVSPQKFKLLDYGHQINQDSSPTAVTKADFVIAVNGTTIGTMSVVDNYGTPQTTFDLGGTQASGTITQINVGDVIRITSPNGDNAGIENVSMTLRGFAEPEVPCGSLSVSFGASLYSGISGSGGQPLSFVDPINGGAMVTGSHTHVEWAVIAVSPDFGTTWYSLDDELGHGYGFLGIRFDGFGGYLVNSESLYYNTTNIDPTLAENTSNGLRYKLRLTAFGPAGIASATTDVQFFGA